MFQQNRRDLDQEGNIVSSLRTFSLEENSQEGTSIPHSYRNFRLEENSQEGASIPHSCRNFSLEENSQEGTGILHSHRTFSMEENSQEGPIIPHPYRTFSLEGNIPVFNSQERISSPLSARRTSQERNFGEFNHSNKEGNACSTLDQVNITSF